MGFFDKLFNNDSEDLNPEDITMRIFDNIDPDFVDTINNMKSVTISVTTREPSKAIEATHWDGLTPEAQDALTKQGFYRKGGEIDVIQIEP